MIPFAILVIEDDDDREFMTQLYIDNQRLMYLEIKKLVADDWIAEDILHDSIVRLIDKIPLLRSLDKRRRINYLVTTVRNQTKNYYRSKQKEKISSLDSSPGLLNTILWSDEEIGDQIHWRLQAEKLKSIWPELSDSTKQLLERKYILAQTDDEIALAFNIKASSVRMKLVRARREVLLIMNHSSN